MQPYVPLPPDVTRLIASVEGLTVRDILNLCEADKRMKRTICESKVFWNTLLRQRSGYGEGRIKSLINDIPRIQHELYYLERPLSSKDGLAIFIKTSWMPKDLRLENIVFTDSRGQRRFATDPVVYDILSQKIAFPSPLVVALPRFRSDDGRVLPGADLVNLVELEVSTPISIFELISVISNYYLEEIAAVPYLLSYTTRYTTFFVPYSAYLGKNTNNESVLKILGAVDAR